MRQQKPPSTPRHKQPFRLFWHSVTVGSTQLLGHGDETRWAYTEAQARLLLHHSLDQRFGRHVFVSWAEETLSGDSPSSPNLAHRQTSPSQTELFPVRRVRSGTA